MRINEKKITAINKAYEEMRGTSKTYIPNTHQLRVSDSLGGAGIFARNWHICDVDKLEDMITELTAIKKAIEEETGIY